MCLKIFNNERHIDKETFKQIFRDHRKVFQKKRIRYSSGYYDEVIEKMLNCGKEFSGYSVYVCGECGGDEKK